MEEKNDQKLTENEAEITKNFVENLAKSCKGLVYMSETDAEFTIFNGKKTDNLTKETFLTEISGSPVVAVNANIEEQNFEQFFLRLTTIKDWFGEIEKQKAKRFAELQNLLKSNLKNLKVFRIGKIRFDIYIVGTNAENNIIGLKTNAVET